MNQTLHPNGVADVPWPTSDYSTRVPDTSMLPGTQHAPPAAVQALNRAVQGAHDAVDRFSDSTTPRVRQLSARVDGLRDTVRRNPLVALAAALALGAAVAGIARRTRPATRR